MPLLALLLLPAALLAEDAKKTEPQVIPLWNGHARVDTKTFEDGDAKLTIHLPLPEKANGAAVVICPGGGYGGLVVGAEGHGIAQWLNSHGMAGCVLEYRLPKGRPYVPLLDAQRAIRTVRANAPRSGSIDPGSASASWASRPAGIWPRPPARTSTTAIRRPTDPIERVSCRPDFVILVYPVITMGEKTHGGSKTNLLGREPEAGTGRALLQREAGDRQHAAHVPGARDGRQGGAAREQPDVLRGAARRTKSRPSTSNSPPAATASMATRARCGTPGKPRR